MTLNSTTNHDVELVESLHKFAYSWYSVWNDWTRVENVIKSAIGVKLSLKNTSPVIGALQLCVRLTDSAQQHATDAVLYTLDLALSSKYFGKT